MHSLLARQAVPAPKVFVLTTPANHLVGVPRLADKGLFQSYVFGFRDRHFAEIIAGSLEGYYEKHGTFAGVNMLDLQPTARPHWQQRRAMGVQEVPLADLVHRLRGTGVMVALLSRDLDQTDELVFRCHDVQTDTTTASVVKFLNRVWTTSTPAPPAAAAAEPESTGPASVVASPIAQILAASLIASLALADAVSVVWLLNLR